METDVNQEWKESPEAIGLVVDAVNNEDFGAVIDLVEKGVNINRVSDDGFTPLMVASYRGNRDIVEYLVAMGADVNLCNESGVYPMHYAALGGSMAVAELLFVNGAQLDCPAYDGLMWTELHCSAFAGKADVFEFLQGVGANAKIRDAEGFMPHEVVKRGTPEAQAIEQVVFKALQPPSAGPSSSAVPE